MGNKKWDWLRWIAVLPGAIAIYVVVNLLLIIAYWVSEKLGGGGRLNDFLLKPLAACFAVYSYLAWGVFIAPNYRRITALVLMIVWFIPAGYILLVSIQTKNYSDLITYILEMIVIVCTYLYINSSEEYETAT